MIPVIRNKLKIALPLLLIFSGLLIGTEAAHAERFTRRTPKTQKVCSKPTSRAAIVKCFLVDYVLEEIIERTTITVEAPDNPDNPMPGGKGTLTRTGGGGERVVSRKVRVIRRTPV
jgi:hypothetical protein